MTLVAWLTFVLRFLASLTACRPAANHSAGVLGPAAGTAMGLLSTKLAARASTFLTNGIDSLLSLRPRHFTLIWTDCKEWERGRGGRLFAGAASWGRVPRKYYR